MASHGYRGMLGCSILNSVFFPGIKKFFFVLEFCAED